MTEQKHTAEEHKQESSEIYDQIHPVFKNKCSVSVEMALAHAVFDVMLAGYPTLHNKEDVIQHLAVFMNIIINNMSVVFVGEEAKNESDTSTKH